ncbi:MAG: hypothetical protein Kow0068_03870 [Marinilabiliales bacterium]
MKYFILILLVTFCLSAFSQDESLLDRYINEALENNPVLKQKQLSYQKALYELKEASGLFYPSLSIQARYTVAHGGRTFDIPVGDLMNPVYSSLHDITSTAYQFGIADQVFPDTSIDNQVVNFLREHEHETKAELVQPLFSPDIYYNRKIKKNMLRVQNADIYTYKNYLIAEIKKAYFTFLKVCEYKQLLNDNHKLLEEYLRINKKLFENDKVTIDAVYRAESELSKIDQLIASTEKDIILSTAYFNYLIGRPLDENIEKENYDDLSSIFFSIDSAKSAAIQNRDELEQLEAFYDISESNIYRNKFNRLPEIFAVVDYGFQGEEYSFTDKDDFVLASFVLKWNIFSGWQKSAQIQQAKIEKQIIENKRTDAEQKILMEVMSAYYDMQQSQKQIASAENELKYAESVFKIIKDKYKEGTATQLEYLDAYTNQMEANRKLIIEKYEYLIKQAEFERVISDNK